METAFLLVALVSVVLAGTELAERVRLPAPLVLIVLGVVASYLPFVPTIHLEAEVVLLGLLPPLLYTAAIQTSLVDFTANRRPILLLSVGLVVLTTFTVGALLQWLMPGLGWPAALAIGAVVAPPDAVAATAIARQIGLPRRIVTVLEGESLLNDATALVALRTAIAAIAGSVSLGGVAVDFLRAAGGGAIIGFLVFLLIAFIRRHIHDALLDTSVSFVTPFLAYLVAERVHSSGVISVVIAGLLLGHKAPLIQTAQSRITERTTWRTMAFVLEHTVFLLIGLQARWIIEGVVGSSFSAAQVALFCAATLAVVILTRLAWVAVSRVPLLRRSGRDSQHTPWGYSFIIGWAGMRGVVTLAAAFIIPVDAPHRDVLLVIAFAVVAGTLLIQGLSLPWFTRRLDVPAPDPAEDALFRASLIQQATQAGLDRMAAIDYDDPHGVCDLIRSRLDQRSFAAWERLGTVAGVESPSELYARVRLEMIEAERAKVLAVRGEGRIPSDVISDVLGMLDVEESLVVATIDRTSDTRASALTFTAGQECADLHDHPVPDAAHSPALDGAVCAGCVADGQTWVALRRCLDCGNIGCCDSSLGRHATAHFHDTGHPVMQSAQPGESWRWCYIHHLTA